MKNVRGIESLCLFTFLICLFLFNFYCSANLNYELSCEELLLLVYQKFKVGTWESNIFKVAATFSQQEHLCC